MERLVIDIETAPHLLAGFGLFNQYMTTDHLLEVGSTLCFAAKWVGQRNIEFRSAWKDGPEKMIERAWELMDRADAVISYNGKKFDLPTLSREFVKGSQEPPSNYANIDLYLIVRSQFKFASNKLDFVCRELGIGAKLPHKGMELWQGVMAGNPKDQRIMERYNKQDVRITERLYRRLLPWIKTHPNFALYTEDERPVCTNCGSAQVWKIGKETIKKKTQAYQRYRCKKCGTEMRGRTTVLSPEKRRNVLVQS